MEYFQCPECGSEDCWFGRSIEVYEDGTEDGMHMRCSDCGKTFEELFPEEYDDGK